MSSGNSQDGANTRTLIIVLSTVLPVVGLVIIAVAVHLCLRSRRLKRLALFHRGITPIDDDEIATWKINRSASEKDAALFKHGKQYSYASIYTQKKAPSVIQYQNGGRPSYDASPLSPQSFIRKQSVDLTQTPQSAVLARAPNAREGLTDETIPGDHPFLPSPSLKRQPSKLSKLPPKSPGANHRVRGSRSSSSINNFSEGWYGDNVGTSPRTSTDYPSTRGHSRVYSTSTAPPRLSFVDFPAESDLLTGLSPPPSHRTEIGRAFG